MSTMPWLGAVLPAPLVLLPVLSALLQLEGCEEKEEGGEGGGSSFRQDVYGDAKESWGIASCETKAQSAPHDIAPFRGLSLEYLPGRRRGVRGAERETPGQVAAQLKQLIRILVQAGMAIALR